MQLKLHENINCIVGKNGSGKTNLIDAIYYLSMTKSSIGNSDSQCIKRGSDFFLINGRYHFFEKEATESITCSHKSGIKVVKRNSKEYTKLSEHIGLIPIIMSSPNDTVLITDSADERRRHLNAFLSQVATGYLSLVMRYNGLLSQRNKTLKAMGRFDEILELLNTQLSEVAMQIYDIRRTYLERLTPLAQNIYNTICDGNEQIMLKYKSDLEQGSLDELLKISFDKDIMMGHTTVGIHRDDIKIYIDNMPIKRFGSQGQQKSMLVALKLAEAELIFEEKGVKPILLLDDVFDKLDPSRVSNLLGIVNGKNFGQIFITDSDPHRMNNIIETIGESSGRKTDSNYMLFEVQNGEIIAMDKEFASEISSK